MALLMLAACGPLKWHKDGADTAALQRDLAECRTKARQQAQQAAPLFGQSRPPVIATDTQGRFVTGQAGRYDTDRALLEHDLMRVCMGDRGYELVPANAR